MRIEATVGGVTLLVERLVEISATEGDRVKVAVFIDGKDKGTAMISGRQWHDFVEASRLLLALRSSQVPS